MVSDYPFCGCLEAGEWRWRCIGFALAAIFCQFWPILPIHPLHCATCFGHFWPTKHPTKYSRLLNHGASGILFNPKTVKSQIQGNIFCKNSLATYLSALIIFPLQLKGVKHTLLDKFKALFPVIMLYPQLQWSKCHRGEILPREGGEAHSHRLML